MSKVIRFFHIRPIVRQKGQWVPRRNGGATVRVVGDTEEVGTVEVQTIFCVNKDLYNKKIGRTLASESPVKVVPLRMLAKELLEISEEVDQFCKAKTEDTDYNWAIRYFLPKVEV